MIDPEVELLRRQLESLQTRVAAVEGFIPLHLRGSVPGWFHAAQIGLGPDAASAMHINLQGNQPGVAPRINVNDVTGTVRAEWGNLAANGNSPAQFGFRANDNNGNPFFDSQGMFAGLMTQVPGSPAHAAATNYSPGPAVTTMTSITFTPTRTLNYLAMYGITAKCTSTSAGTFANVQIYVDGVFNQPTVNIFDKGVGGYTNGSGFNVLTLSGGGSHTVALTCNTDDTSTTLVNDGGYLFVFQLGS